MAALNTSRIFSVIVYLAVFVAGVAVGGVASGMRRPHRPDLDQQVASGMRRLERELTLTADQRAALTPLVRQALQRREEVDAHARNEWGAILGELQQAVDGTLSGAQIPRWHVFIAHERESLLRGRAAPGDQR